LTHLYILHSSFTARTTRVSNPVCSPSLRASASVLSWSLPSPLSLLLISLHSAAQPAFPWSFLLL